MTDPGYTHISVLVDRSGSMSAIRSDAEGGLRSFLSEQEKLPGKLTVSLYDFDGEYRCVASAVTASAAVQGWKLTPRGMTALLDAIGRAVVETGDTLSRIQEHERPGKVVFVVITDGLENASSEYTRERVFDMISHQRDVYDWQFLFMAANQDAIATGATMGFAPTASMTYNASATGVKSMYAVAKGALSDYRMGKTRAAVFSDLGDDA